MFGFVSRKRYDALSQAHSITRSDYVKVLQQLNIERLRSDRMAKHIERLTPQARRQGAFRESGDAGNT